MKGDWTPAMVLLVASLLIMVVMLALHFYYPIINADNYCNQYAHDINWQQGKAAGSNDKCPPPDPIITAIICKCSDQEYSSNPWQFSYIVTVCKPRWET